MTVIIRSSESHGYVRALCPLILGPSLLTFASLSHGPPEVPPPGFGLCEMIVLSGERTDIGSLEAVSSLHLLKKDIVVIKRGSFSAPAKSKGKP